MSQLKKLLFTEKLHDYEGRVWRFSVYKAIAWCIVIAIFSIIIYGLYIAENSKEFFGNVLFYIIVISISMVVILFVTGTFKKFRAVVTRFLLIIIVMTFLYMVFGIIFSKFTDISFYSGYSTWIVLCALAGYGAKNENIFNGHLDRHDVFYSLLIFVIMVGANFPINSNGGFLANLDLLVEKILSLIPIISNILSNV